VVNKINLLRKPLLRYQYFNNGIKSKKTEPFYFAITICKTRNKWQKEGHFTTSVPVDPKLWVGQQYCQKNTRSNEGRV